ncbi:MAG: hypothetical protein ACTSP0_04480 [Alphaproteobacteria bacterium]
MDERIGVADEEWTVIGPLLSSERGRRGLPTQAKRRFLRNANGYWDKVTSQMCKCP